MKIRNIKNYVKFLLLVFSFFINIWFLINYVSPCIKMYICLAYPSLTYKGDKTVLEEDVIYLEKLAIRDIRLDVNSKYADGTTYHKKNYIVKKNRLSKKKTYQLLSNYCKEYYENHNSYDEIEFFFYEECGTMPWFWNNDGYFPDLEMNSSCLICRVFISKEEIKFMEGGW